MRPRSTYTLASRRRVGRRKKMFKKNKKRKAGKLAITKKLEIQIPQIKVIF